MGIQRLYFIIADISGYTRFVTAHKESLLHAERIIGNLLEAVMSEAHTPIRVHELLGDAVTMYAPAEGISSDEIYACVQRMHTAFTDVEANHVSSCSICSCDACSNVGKLRLKIICHTGDAVFTSVGGMQKISGEDVILTHRWLKNAIPSREYFLFTDAFTEELDTALKNNFTRHQEVLEGLGMKIAYVWNLSTEIVPAKVSFLQRLRRHTQLNIHALKRNLGAQQKAFRNLQFTDE